MQTTPSLSWKQQLEKFLFAEEVPYGFALLRITLPIVLLQGVLARWRFSEDLYSTNGVTVSLMENFQCVNWLPPMSPFPTACIMTMLVVFLVTSCVGWCTRISLIGSFVIHTYLACNDMATSMTKFTVIETHVLLLLSVSGCGNIWSVDSWLAGQRNPGRAPLSERPAWALVPVWPERLLTLMVGAAYVGAALTKLHMPEYITGEAISYWIMSNPNFRHYIGEWMSQYPGLLKLSASFTFLWELLFVFLVWRPLTRYLVFAMGLFFHFMAAITLGEVIFLFVMCSVYLGCLWESEAVVGMSLLRRAWSALSTWVPQRVRQLRLPGLSVPAVVRQAAPRWQFAVFSVLAVAIGLTGAWVHRKLDLYGVNRPEGRYTLPEISQEEVERLFVSGEPIRETDKYLGVRVGSMLVSGRLSNQVDKFRHGEVVICEASLNPPHEDMWIECNLMDQDKKIINRDGGIAAREARYAQFNYKLTEALEPGRYTLVVKSRGQVICHRDFTLEGKAPEVVTAPVAN